MRAREFIVEYRTGSIQDDVADALPSTFVIPQLQNQDAYRQYRFGVALAYAKGSRAGDQPDFNARSAWGENAIVVAYDNESELMVGQALEHMGLSKNDKKRISTPKSTETTSVNTTSPVSKRKKNKYGV